MPVATYEKLSEKVAVITLNDGRANSFSFEMVAVLSELLDQAKSDLCQCEGALVLAGSDKMLSGGFDLASMKDLATSRNLVVAGSSFVEKLLHFPRPVVIAATGPAVALGGFLLLTGDYRIGAATAKNGKQLKVGLNETNIGMTLPQFFAGLARWRLPSHRLDEAMGIGMIFDAQKAKDVGFLDELVPQEQVLEASKKKAEELASWCKHPAFQDNKELARRPLFDFIEGPVCQQQKKEWTSVTSKL